MKNLLFIFLLLFSASLHAETIPSTDTEQHPYNGSIYTSRGAFCSAFAAHQFPDMEANGFNPVLVGVSGNNCAYIVYTGAPTDYYPIQIEIIKTCPEGYTLDEGGLTCTGEGLPPPIDCEDPARDLGGAPYGGAGTLPSSICVSGCEYPINTGASGCKNGVCYFETTVGAPSGSCEEDSGAVEKNEDNRTPEEKCISNRQGYVTSGGVVSCVGAGTPGSGDIFIKDGPSTTDTNGTVTGSSTETTVNSNGTVTETTTTTPDVGEPVTETTTQSKYSYCRENPYSLICRDLTNNCEDCAKEVTLSNIRDIILSTPEGDPSLTGEGVTQNLNDELDSTFLTNQDAVTNWLANSGIQAIYENSILPLSPFSQVSQGSTPDCEFAFEFMETTRKLTICEAQPALHTALSFVFFILLVLGVLNLMTERPDGT